MDRAYDEVSQIDCVTAQHTDPTYSRIKTMDRNGHIEAHFG